MDQSATIIGQEKIDNSNSKQKKVFSLLALTFLCVTLVAGLYLVGKRVSFRKKANENCSVWFDNQINTNLLGEGRICKVNRGEKVFDIQAGQSSDQNKFRLDWVCGNDISSFAVKNTDDSGSANISGMCFLDASATRCSSDSCIFSKKKAGYVICKGFNPGLYKIWLDFSSASSPTLTPTLTLTPGATLTPPSTPTLTPTPTITLAPTPTQNLTCAEIGLEERRKNPTQGTNVYSTCLANVTPTIFCAADATGVPSCFSKKKFESNDCKATSKDCLVTIQQICRTGETCVVNSSGCSCVQR